MTTIDFHTHCFPASLAPRALAGLSHASGGLRPYTDGTPEGLLRSMEENDVQISVVQHIATNPHQQATVNRFAAEIQSDRLISFGSVHPDAPDTLETLEHIKASGLKGIKFHPEYQSFYVNDLKMKPIYQKASSLGLIVLFHAGFDYGFAPPYHCMPEQLESALRWLDTPVVAAHWGGLCCGEEVLRHLCGLPLYFDLSFGYGTMPKDVAQRIIEKHGVDRLLFGSDSPWHRPAQERRLLDSLDLTPEERQKIDWENAAKLLHLSQMIKE